MQKLSGLLLDVYDDNHGDTLREMYPERALVPDLVKQAHLLEVEERNKLPDDLFALVLTDGDTTLRKFACTDPGNTALSIAYFLKTGGKLPEQAQKTAAQNLLIACDWYGLEPPEALQKAAGIGGALMSLGGKALGWAKSNPMKALGVGLAIPSVVGAGKQVGSNLGQVAAAEHAAGGFGQIARI